MVLAIHADQIKTHGGSLGLRDRGLLDSAVERARNRWGYEPDTDVCGLAASYEFGIAKNHASMDGNERVAFQAMYLFLGLNGLRIEAQEEEVVSLILALATSEVDEPGLATWLRSHTITR